MSGYATIDDDGRVQLGHNHPGFADPVYRARRDELASLSAGWRPGDPIPHPVYSDAENKVWENVAARLEPLLARRAARSIREAIPLLNLPSDRVPQLDEVTDALVRLTGFSYGVVAGLADLRTFYGSLADGRFLSTQYVRHPSSPLYTPEPDIVHEVVGHGLSLAVPALADMCRAMGRATRRISDASALEALSRIFWFSIEFGCVWEHDELRAYGAGILSSCGELQTFPTAQIRPLDLAAMARSSYDITRYQTVLFAGRSMSEVVDVVGGFFDVADDDRLLELERACR